MNPADEIVAIINEQNHVVGFAMRKMRAHQLPHRSMYIMVFNFQGDLYVQKRSPSWHRHPHLDR